jgi:hypothetical protein
VYKAGSGAYGLLAPTIEYITVHEGTNPTADLLGTFGTPPSDYQVLVGGTPATIRTWTNDIISIELPETGPTSAGDVQVIVRGHKSNIRQITRWTINAHYKMTGEATLKAEGDFKLVMRADIGEYRQNPGIVFIRPTRGAFADAKSQGTLTGSGERKESCGLSQINAEIWRGSGAWKSTYSSIQPFGIIAALRIDTINKVGGFTFNFSSDGASDPIKVTFRDCAGATRTQLMPMIPPVDGNTIINIPVPGSEIELPFMGKNITFNGDWSFAAGTMTTPAGMSPGSVLTYDAPIVEFPPDNKNAV